MFDLQSHRLQLTEADPVSTYIIIAPKGFDSEHFLLYLQVEHHELFLCVHYQKKCETHSSYLENKSERSYGHIEEVCGTALPMSVHLLSISSSLVNKQSLAGGLCDVRAGLAIIVLSSNSCTELFHTVTHVVLHSTTLVHHNTSSLWSHRLPLALAVKETVFQSYTKH